MSETLAQALVQRADQSGDRVLLRMGAEQFTAADTHARALRVAHALRALGDGPGDRVAVFAPNMPETFFSWLGCAMLGGVEVPINVDARGAFLRYVHDDAAPAVLIGDEERLRRAGAELERFDGRAVVVGPHEPEAFGVVGRPLVMSELVDAAPEDELRGPAPSDLATIMYTSGTTGPSKGVMIAHAYFPHWGRGLVEPAALGPGDTHYCAQPLFHIDPRHGFTAALMGGAAFALGTRFSASRFWDEIRASDANRFQFIGTMMWMLYKQPERADDAEQPATIGLGSAIPVEIHEAFERRFGTRVFESYGMTEVGMLSYQRAGWRKIGTVGQAAPGVEMRIVDEHDRPLPPDEVGEAVFRPEEPYVTALGYWRKPEATVEAWRNLWFHTGDLMSVDAAGHFTYCGRSKDSVRRRGENVSCWEVEQAFMNHEAVLEAAAFGVASEVGEDEVAILVVVKSDRDVDHAELHAFVSADLPRFAVPRFIEFVDELPKTPSERIAKAKVRERGLRDDAWDAEAARGMPA
jgi:crotonobetaine/carnitine-CoA ligase